MNSTNQTVLGPNVRTDMSKLDDVEYRRLYMSAKNLLELAFPEIKYTR